MASCRTSFVSILNNDDNPSFAVRSAPMLSRHHSSPSYSYQPDHQHPPVHDYRSNAYTESPAVSPRVMRRPFDPVSEAVHPASPGSDSSHDYIANPHAFFQPQYGRQEFYTYPPTMLPSERRLSMPSPAEPPSPQTSLSGSKDSIQTKGSRKNKYPCPYAASHSCSATFTTSGHAARHGKKHTGEKSVHCPICNKAFTRKDNMKQHIRTHRTHSEDSQTGLARDGNSAYSANHNRSISQSRVDRNVYQNMPRVDSTLPRGSHHQTPF
ncbi:C2H2 transcription factor Egr2 [Aspergillus sclerotialis]|uniref:C2H2 transcription factor Egr2 n=1 Tax=Aspergillus sclerotialis TaxID=2070753 RepID=A0A3A2ZIB0_9EURO|nr:C2H2 transcription factor Egr2 [Aspergillus sclerotialis]